MYEATTSSVKRYFEVPTRWQWYVNLPIYGAVFKRQAAIVLAELVKRIPNPETKRILDAGCGYGRYTRLICEMGFEVYAMDISKMMLNAARAYCKRANMGDINWMPFADSSFDALLCIDVSDHLESLEKAIDELSRVLKKDGILFVTISNRNSFIAHTGINCIRKLFRFLHLGFGAPIHNTFSASQLQMLLERHYVTVEILPIHFPYLPWAAPLGFLGIAQGKL
jgi:ubiquinone/menaquinone biosynthesis C-methylase UbiE